MVYERVTELEKSIMESLRGRETNESLLVRLARVEGQVHGIGKMVREGRQCDQVLTQILAARAALEKVAAVVVATSIDECLVSAPEEARKTIATSLGLLTRS
jgi:CsoR family transcriptional regulator, copper-sensing transcriptional repressor